MLAMKDFCCFKFSDKWKNDKNKKLHQRSSFIFVQLILNGFIITITPDFKRIFVTKYFEFLLFVFNLKNKLSNKIFRIN